MNQERVEEVKIVYGLNDKPPIVPAIVYGLQHMVSCLVGAIVVPFIFSGVLGLSPFETAELIGLTLLGVGIGTILQVRFGSKLPIVTGSSYSFIVPSIAVMNASGVTGAGALAYLSGALILGAIVPILMGYLKVIGVLKRVFTPIVIASVITLITLGLYEFAANTAGSNWLVSLIVFFSVCLFSQILPRKLGLWKLGTFSVLLSALIGYIICAIGTATGAFPAGSPASLDFSPVLESPWFFFPQPLFWGVPKFTFVGFLIIVAGYLAMMAETVGDIYVVSSVSGEKDPTKEQLNKGVGIQGIANAIAGLFGGVAITSYTDNIGVIGLTRVASKYVVYIAAIIFIVLSFFGKFATALAVMPDPVKGGLYMAIFGLVVGFGASNLRRADMTSTRNVFIYGSSLIFGLGMPRWVGANPLTFDPAWFSVWLAAVLSTPMFIGGLWAFVLEQILPASDEERGLFAEDSTDA